MTAPPALDLDTSALLRATPEEGFRLDGLELLTADERLRAAAEGA